MEHVETTKDTKPNAAERAAETAKDAARTAKDKAERAWDRLTDKVEEMIPGDSDGDGR